MVLGSPTRPWFSNLACYSTLWNVEVLSNFTRPWIPALFSRPTHPSFWSSAVFPTLWTLAVLSIPTPPSLWASASPTIFYPLLFLTQSILCDSTPLFWNPVASPTL